ncbi:MAG: FAD-dependent oxidoreductase, partial [Chloroflexota bacterium]
HIVDKKCRAGVCKELVYARCSNACPAGQDVPKYVGLIAEGKIEEAYQVITETNPFPSICGRVCEHPCEEKCRRGQLDDALSIRALKRFVADEMRGRRPRPPEVRLDRKVAVVGGGPAGLAAANSLARMGYQVTVFEALPMLGGMLAVGIPEYRLPRAVLNDEIENVLALGVQAKTGMALGKDFSLEELTARGYDAIFLAMGAHSSAKLGIAGEDTPGVIHGVQFLREVNLGRPAALQGKKVAVVGGGNVAMDAARVALRLGAQAVHVVYRRTRDEMPAQDEEIEDALKEGVRLHFLVAPKEVVNGTGRVTGLRCARMVLSDFDRSGRRRPVELKDSDFVLDVDVVIPAIGQATDATCIDGDCIRWTRRGTIEVEPHTMATTVPGVFAGGDAVAGPATVVEAIAEGNRAARAIDRYLKGEPVLWEPPAGPTWGKPATTVRPEYGIVEEEARRPVTAKAAPEERRRSFVEVAIGYTREMAMAEARRCLRCDLEAR